MKFRKMIVFTLIFCTLFSSTVQASSTTDTDTEETETFKSEFWTGSFEHGYYGTIDAKFVVESESTVDTYICIKNVDDETTKCGFLFVSDVPTTVNYYLMTDYSSGGNGWINYSGNRILDLTNDISSIFAWYDNETGHDYWMSYLSQFGITEDNYEEFRTWCKGKYIGYAENNFVLSDDTLNCSTMEITESETAITDKITTMRVCSNSIYSWQTKGFVDHHYFVPFVYGKKYSGDSSNSKTFIVYRETVTYFQGLEQVYKNNFTWKVADYPEFEGCYVEVRACPLYVYMNRDKYPYNSIDWYYFSSIDASNKKATQKEMLKIPFENGIATAYKTTLDDYYLNLFQQIMNSITFFSQNEHYTYQVRVMSEDGKRYSDWCTFHNNSLGQAAGSTTVVDDNGNVTDTNVTEDVNYDEDMEDNPWNTFDDAGNTPNEDDNVETGDTSYSVSNFTNWIYTSINSVGQFPKLLETCYGWLPNGVVYAIGVSMVLIIIVRVLGR